MSMRIESKSHGVGFQPTKTGGGIVIRGAREHNLKHIDLTLPRNRLIVITGLSGSGKSSLAFDTLYAEGQRRYVESLSAYARQFLEQLEKPDVESIEGLSPAIAIEQRTAGSNPRSTVATQTELYDYLRLLFARIGQPHCPKCHRPIAQQSAQQIVERVAALPRRGELWVLAPLVRGRKGEYQELFRAVRKDGFVRVRVDGQLRELDQPIALDKQRKHTIEVVVDRLALDAESRARLTDSVETALKVGKGIVIIAAGQGSRVKGQGKDELVFSELLTCPTCGFSLEEISPRIFSFNSPYGACERCAGLGTRLTIDPDLVVPDQTKSLRDGAIKPWRRGGMQMVLYYRRLIREIAEHYHISLEMPFSQLEPKAQRALLYGTRESVWGGPFEGVISNLQRRFEETESDFVKEEITKYMSVLPCPDCRGARLKSASLAVTIADCSIDQVTRMSVEASQAWFAGLRLTDRQKVIARQVLKEIQNRLRFLLDVGLGYLTLDRASGTLSGGEAQRIRLATQVGSGLVGVLYILDEPSIGLHQRDQLRLLATLERLRDLGNTLVVVEHDEATIRQADYIVDLGPGAGKHGGEVVAAGPLADLLASRRSITAQYLRGARQIAVPATRRPVDQRRQLAIRNAHEHNLKHINVDIPLGTFVCVTGVSGSGKSTLVDEIVYRALAQRLYHSPLKPGRHGSLHGTEHIDKVIVIDQSPIGRTPRSNPATYTGAYGPIRDLFSQLPQARARGYRPGRFSFNVKGGRCEACQGDGIKRIEMHFLPDVYVHCEVCKGRRFNEATLQILYKGHSIADVLKMTVEDAVAVFGNIPAIADKLHTVNDVGLGYIELGQSATTLSGGEAQRVKLAKELSKRATGRTLYLLDEPTTGLHFADIEKLLQVLHALVDQGNTVLVIEHNLDVIKTADYLIDLGPEGGEAGGRIVAVGSPEAVASVERSYTGQHLRPLLKKGRRSKVEGRRKSNSPFTLHPSPFTALVLVALLSLAAPLWADEMMAARQAMVDGFFDVARERLESVLRRPSEPTETAHAQLLLGQCDLHLKRLPKALAAFEAVLANATAATFHPEALWWLGETYRKDKRFSEARIAYQRLIAQFPDSAWRWKAEYGSAVCEYELGDDASALPHFEALAAPRPQSGVARDAELMRGVVLVRLKRFDEARRVLGRLSQTAHDVPTASTALYYLAEAAYEQGAYQEALERYREALRIAPNPQLMGHITYGLGWAAYKAGQYVEAESALRQFHKFAPDYPLRDAALFVRGQSARRMGRYEEALKLFDELTAAYPHSEWRDDVLLARGEVLVELGRLEESAALFEAALAQRKPGAQSDEWMLQLAWMYHHQGNDAKAIPLFERLAQDSTNEEYRVSALLHLGAIYNAQGMESTALKHYQCLVEAYPQRREANEVRLWLTEYWSREGDRLRQGGLYEEALRAYRHALTTTTQAAQPALQYAIGASYEGWGRRDQALAAYLELMVAHPHDTTWVVKAQLACAKLYEANQQWQEAGRMYTALAAQPVEEARYATERLEWLTAQGYMRPGLTER